MPVEAYKSESASVVGQTIDLGKTRNNWIFQFDPEKLGRFEKHCKDILVFQNGLFFPIHPAGKPVRSSVVYIDKPFTEFSVLVNLLIPTHRPFFNSIWCTPIICTESRTRKWTSSRRTSSFPIQTWNRRVKRWQEELGSRWPFGTSRKLWKISN